MDRVFGIFLLLMIGLFASFGPWFSPYTYDEIHLSDQNLPPSATYWFGTDDLGRDLFVRMAFGARLTLAVALAAGFVDLVIGTIWGGVAGFVGGKTEEWMMALCDIFYALPLVLVSTVVMLFLPSGFFSLVVALSMFGWITMARVVRGQVKVIKTEEFVLASKLFGGGVPYIFRKHLLPNMKGSMMVTLALTIPSAIFLETYLSFLGLGVPPPLASWGTIAQETLHTSQVWIPCICIVLAMLSFHLLAKQ